MSQFDLHVVTVPDNKAQLVIARLIANSNSSMTMQAALEKAGSPPLVLLRGLTQKEAEQHASHLKGLGVSVMIAEIEDPAERADGKAVPPGGADSHPVPASAPAQSNETSQTTESDFGDVAGIRAHNAANKLSDAQPSAHPFVSSSYMSPHVSRTPPSPHTPALHADDIHGHGGGGRLTGGVRIGILEESRRMEAAEERARRKNLMITAAMVGVLLIIGAAIFLIPRGNQFTVSKLPIVGERVGKASSAAKSGGKTAIETVSRTGVSLAPPDSSAQSKDRQRGAVGGQQRQLANQYVDSARASGGHLDKNVAFYKMAISFNRYNHAAWHGLLQAYIDLKMREEARETERQMTEIFGTQATTVSGIVSRSYGELSDAYVNDDGVYRVEYRSRKRDRDGILRDVFNLTRAVRAVCACQNISVFAATGVGKGMIVHTTQEASVHSFSDFSRQANVTWLE